MAAGDKINKGEPYFALMNKYFGEDARTLYGTGSYINIYADRGASILSYYYSIYQMRGTSWTQIATGNIGSGGNAHHIFYRSQWGLTDNNKPIWLYQRAAGSGDADVTGSISGYGYGNTKIYWCTPTFLSSYTNPNYKGNTGVKIIWAHNRSGNLCD